MFDACIDIEFHGHWQTKALDVTPVYQIPPVIDLVITNRAHLQQLRNTLSAINATNFTLNSFDLIGFAVSVLVQLLQGILYMCKL